MDSTYFDKKEKQHIDCLLAFQNVIIKRKSVHATWSDLGKHSVFKLFIHLYFFLESHYKMDNNLESETWEKAHFYTFL